MSYGILQWYTFHKLACFSDLLTPFMYNPIEIIIYYWCSHGPLPVLNTYNPIKKEKQHFI